MMKNFNEEKFKELNKRIGYNEDQCVIGFSNKHFDILLKQKKLKPQHIAFAFSYLYLQSYLFRYTKYDTYVPTVDDLKEILTYSKTTKTLNYIIKDGGLLDAANLTKTIYDFPVVHEWDKDTHTVEFTMVSHFNDDNEYGRKWRKQRGINFNASCKYPVLGFYDDTDSFTEVMVNNNLGGTFYETYNLTLIDWNIFNYCMSHSELGCTGFYLYCFIKSQEGKRGNCMLGLSKMSNYTGIPSRTISRYIKVLRQYNLIHCIPATFVVGADNNEGEEIEKESNTYFANEYSEISDSKRELDKPTYISLTHYREKKRLEELGGADNMAQTLDNTEFNNLFG